MPGEELNVAVVVGFSGDQGLVVRSKESVTVGSGEESLLRFLIERSNEKFFGVEVLKKCRVVGGIGESCECLTSGIDRFVKGNDIASLNLIVDEVK